MQVDLGRIDDRLATAALAQGTLASARSAADEHLRSLATATALAMVSSDELGADHAMLLLRIAGDISSTHIRVLDMYANPSASRPSWAGSSSGSPTSTGDIG